MQTCGMLRLGVLPTGRHLARRVYASGLGNAPGALMNCQEKDGKAKAYQVRQLLNAIEYLAEIQSNGSK